MRSGVEQTERPRALTTRFADFWLLGGASLLVWLVMFAVQGFRSAWAIDQHFKNLTVTTASLSLLVNYPHFLVSYKLAYTPRPRVHHDATGGSCWPSRAARRDLCVSPTRTTTCRSRSCRSSRCCHAIGRAWQQRARVLGTAARRPAVRGSRST